MCERKGAGEMGRKMGRTSKGDEEAALEASLRMIPAGETLTEKAYRVPSLDEDEQRIVRL